MARSVDPPPHQGVYARFRPAMGRVKTPSVFRVARRAAMLSSPHGTHTLPRFPQRSREGFQAGNHQAGGPAAFDALHSRRQGTGDLAPRPRRAGFLPGRWAGLAGADQCGAAEGQWEVEQD